MLELFKRGRRWEGKIKGREGDSHSDSGGVCHYEEIESIQLKQEQNSHSMAHERYRKRYTQCCGVG